jgi:hypothetical protein
MKKITPKMIRDKCAKLNIPHRQCWEATDIGKAWFIKMIMDNDKYAFKDPNPERMDKIWSYLFLYEQHYKKADAEFADKWKKIA